MDNFIYETPTKVFFGKNEEMKIGEILLSYDTRKVLIHYGKESARRSGLLNRIEKCLEEKNIEYVELGGVTANPQLSLVRRGIDLCREEGVDFVLAVGGGSVLDSAKDIANGVANPDIDVWDFSTGKTSPKATMKKGAILTLAAAGSEMSNSCVITNEKTGEKRGYGSPFNRMDFAIENPELTYSVNKYQTACGAVDIAMHTIERFFMPGENTYLTDAVAIAVIKSVMKAGIDCIENPTDYDARANMMWASSLAHNGLTGCGRQFQLTVHQLEHEVSGMYPLVAHGAGLAALWCTWARYVCDSNIERWLFYAEEVWGQTDKSVSPKTRIQNAINLQEDYYRRIEMPVSLRELGVKKEDLPVLALNTSRNKTRVISGYKPLRYEDVLSIFNSAW